MKKPSDECIYAFERHYDMPWDSAGLGNERNGWAAAWEAARKPCLHQIAEPAAAPQAAQAAMPEGWRLVPVEPTVTMLAKGGEDFFDSARNWKGGSTLRDQDHALMIYEAMLAAAPAHPAEGVPAPAAVAVTDEREAFVNWLHGTYPLSYTIVKAADLWFHKHVAALAWQARAALAATPAQATAGESSVVAETPAVRGQQVLVSSGALQMVVNALRRDAAEGRTLRGEMADELLATVAPAAAPVVLPEPVENADGYLPCPFCGSDQVSQSEGTTNTGAAWYYVECEGCEATATPEQWNARALLAGSAPAGAAVDALDAADREFLAIGRAIQRAAGELPADGEIRIDIENGAGAVYVLESEHCDWRYIDSGDVFSAQINAAIDVAIDAAIAAQAGKGAA